MLTLLLACVPKTPEIPAPTPEQAASAPEVEEPALPPGCERIPSEYLGQGDTTWESPSLGTGRLSEHQLDADPEPEAIFFQPGTCGTSGMCEFAVLDGCGGDAWRQVGSFGAMEWLVLDERSAGWKELEAETHWLDQETGEVQQSFGRLVFDGEGYRNIAPPDLTASDAEGQVVARSMPLRGDEEAACPKRRVDVRGQDGDWTKVVEDYVHPHFAVSPSGQVGAMLTCAEHLEGVLVGGQVLKASDPEYAETVAWVEADGQWVLEVSGQGGDGKTHTLRAEPQGEGWGLAE